jgi:peptidyl-tRNA hydrolase
MNVDVYSKMYIAVREDVPDFMVPTLVAHSVLGAHMSFKDEVSYNEWLSESFRKVTLRVSIKEFNKILTLTDHLLYTGYEKTTLNAEPSCVVVCPVYSNKIPNVLKFGKLWKPLDNNT